MNVLLDAALAYAARGWNVHPLVERSRKPQMPEWPRLATTDPEQIVAWWARRDSNVGVTTGPASGLAVLDVDPRHGGMESLARLQALVGPLPTTPAVVTGGGGLHLYYAHPGVKVSSKANAFGPDFPGIDTRGDGGYVVAPPSVHPDSGERYVWWDDEQTAWRGPLAPWPTEQLASLPPTHVPSAPRAAREVRTTGRAGRGGTSRAEKRLAALVRSVEQEQPGRRNHQLFWASCRACEAVRDQGLDLMTAWQAMRDAGRACGLPGVEVDTTVTSAFLDGYALPVEDLRRLRVVQ